MKVVHVILAAIVSIIIFVSVLVPTTTSPTLKDDLYVFGVFGQSNAAYGHEDLDVVNSTIPAIEPGMGFYYGVNGLPISYDTDPASGQIYDICPNGEYVIGNWEPSFIQKMAESGKKTLIINFGVPGRSIVALQPGGYAWAWESSVIVNALSQIDKTKYNVCMAGLLSIHGEADSYHEMATNEYIDRFMTTFNTLKSDFGFDCCLMSIVRDTRGTLIQTAEYQLIESQPDIILGCGETVDFTVENGLMTDDDLHYSQLGDNILGADNAVSWLNSPFVQNSTNTGDYSALVGAIPVLMVLVIIGFIAISAISVYYKR